MSGLDWFFTIFFMALYLLLLFTLAVITFRKGHWVIGIIGIFIPLLWIVGAILPARRGTAYSMR
jgi:hypothetical protein